LRGCIPFFINIHKYNPLLQYGLSVFAKEASTAGLDGTIVPDLPLEEAKDWMAVAKPQGRTWGLV
jgi:tryptophan synthase alpha chain